MRSTTSRESSPQAGTEEQKEKRDQRCYQERDDLVLPSVVLPVGKRLRGPGFAARIVPQQDEPDEEQQSRQHSSEW